MEALVFLVLVLYFLPGITGVYRRKQSASSMLLLNVVFGWTFIGWVAVLAWALSGKRGS